MAADEGFDGPGMGLGRVGGDDGFLEGEEVFAGADDEAVVGDGDDVGVAAVGKGEADGHAAGIGVGGRVGDGGVGGAIGEADRYGDGGDLEMGGAAEFGGFGRSGEGTLADQAFGVGGAIGGIGAGELDHDVEDLLVEVFGFLRSG